MFAFQSQHRSQEAKPSSHSAFEFSLFPGPRLFAMQNPRSISVRPLIERGQLRQTVYLDPYENHRRRNPLAPNAPLVPVDGLHSHAGCDRPDRGRRPSRRASWHQLHAVVRLRGSLAQGDGGTELKKHVLGWHAERIGAIVRFAFRRQSMSAPKDSRCGVLQPSIRLCGTSCPGAWMCVFECCSGYSDRVPVYGSGGWLSYTDEQLADEVASYVNEASRRKAQDRGTGRGP